MAPPPDECGDDRQRGGQAYVGAIHHMRLLRTEGREGLPGELSFVDLGQAAEDQNGTDVRKYRGAERVESLSEGQTAMRSARLAQQADQRICHDL